MNMPTIARASWPRIGGIVTSAIKALHEEASSPASRSVAGAEAAEEPPLTVIERRHGWQVVDFGEFWRYRELLLSLTWRDVKVRYKQTVLGVAWAVLQPLATMVVFALFLGPVVAPRSAEFPYPL